jgi:hypothetical protein
MIQASGGLHAPASLPTNNESPVGWVGPTAGLYVAHENNAPVGNGTTSSRMLPATQSLNCGKSAPINYKIYFKTISGLLVLKRETFLFS